jgi:hypothetical protein
LELHLILGGLFYQQPNIFSSSGFGLASHFE